MEGIKRVVSLDVQILRGFAYRPLRRVWFDRETVLMALTDSRAGCSTGMTSPQKFDITTEPTGQIRVRYVFSTSPRPTAHVEVLMVVRNCSVSTCPPA